MLHGFHLQNYNEFKGGVRWRDYVNLTLNDFSVIVIRRYDWLDWEQSTYLVQLFGVVVFNKLKDWKGN